MPADLGGVLGLERRNGFVEVDPPVPCGLMREVAAVFFCCGGVTGAFAGRKDAPGPVSSEGVGSVNGSKMYSVACLMESVSHCHA